ncbi:hypothetical protein J1614_002896 [Plenodomus biglobosus]|nr:hypothetical protein J1614_002896 [Plenodomus biglobosus]
MALQAHKDWPSNSPLTDSILLMELGMFNALTGIGGAGQFDTRASNASNTALYATFSVVGFFAGTVTNTLGIRTALSFGGMGKDVDLDNNEAKFQGAISDATYATFLVLTLLGACLSWTLVDARHVVRRDGSRIIIMKHPTWKSEILGLWETLRSDSYIILLFPMFFASNWFYTYQFQDVNKARFNIRTRALNGTLYWLAQILGAFVSGFALDFPNIRRTSRAKFAWLAMFVLTFAVWGAGYVFQRTYTRDNITELYDWTSDGYIGPMFLYIAYGFYDAAWQTCVFMSAISNNSRKLANFAGFYKGIQSAGAAVMWRLDDYKISYMNLFASCWILLAGSLMIALPVMLLKIKDTVPVEEDLKFTDETMEDIMGPRASYEPLDKASELKTWRA